ncbi:MAG: carboxylesterase family protein [Deltaproteobacteria bacterium]|jgi:para-nitrobenzyl esterase|nr:carboxylesterase family protein [Deltaproteobacteria bacterium]
MEKLANPPAGPVKGRVKDGIASFKGIPYAKPPLGDSRFAPAEKAEPWTDVLDASEFGPISSQYAGDNDFISPRPGTCVISEDSLTLNVWAPADAEPGDGLPAYVYVHGGGFSKGSSSQPKYGRLAFGKNKSPFYDGGPFAKAGVILVTFNYRLGILGFFSSRETLARHGTTGNWGLSDQIRALEWVRDNIEAFGGNPDDVTVGGESAGGMSVSSLVVSPLAKGLFKKAIVESGTVLSLSQVPVCRGHLDRAVALGGTILSLFDLKDDAGGLEGLRRVDAEVLAKISALDFDFTRVCPFALMPVRDGRIIPGDPIGTLEKGEQNAVSLLVGANRDEGSLFVPKKAAPEGLAGAEAAFLGLEALEIFRKLPLFKDKGLSRFEKTRAAVAYSVFTAGTKRFADLHARLAPTYVYRFDYVSTPAKFMGLGAHHGGELPMVFHNLPSFPFSLGFGAGKLARVMFAAWISFIKTGDPNPPGADPRWPLYDPKAPRVMVFDKISRVAPYPDAEALDKMSDAFFGKIRTKSDPADPGGS